MSAGIVVESPVVELLTFQVWDADAGEWSDLADRATSVTIRRGAQQRGAGLETQVGTLDAELYGALDLSRVAALRPNAPIRVVRPQLAPAMAWDLTPGKAADNTASKAMWARIVPTFVNGEAQSTGYSNAVFSNGFEANWSSAREETLLRSGTLLLASPNDYSGTTPNNPKPVGVFDAGSTYTLSAMLRNRGPVARSYRLVVFTGDPTAPKIIAHSEAYTPADVYPGVRASVDFVAPGNDDWQVGVALEGDAVASNYALLLRVYVADVQIWDHGRERPEFTGTIADVYQSVQLDKSTGEKHTYTTVQAVDAVQSLANTDRYGVLATSGAGYQTWADRIDQLAASALVPIDAPAERDLVVFDQARKVLGAGGTYTDNWSTGGTLDNATGYYVGYWGNGEYRVYPLPNWVYDGPYATTLRGVNVGRKFYGFDPTLGYVAVLTVTIPTNSGVTLGDWRLAFDNGNALQWGPAVDMTKTGAQTIAFQFQPSSPYGSVGLYQAGTAAFPKGSSVTVKVSDMRVLRVGLTDPYVLQDVAYESTLLNHFDLACNSVGARWYVTKRGTALFRRAEEDAVAGARFSDTDAGDVSYTDVQLGYDTRNVVNSLKLNQHGYDPATGNADDTAQTFTDGDSIAHWGARASELDTCLYLGGPHAGDAETRAREVMSSLRAPRYAVQSFTINVQSDPDVLDAVELRSTVAIDYEGIRQRARVVSLEHSITPTRWMTTVTVNEPHIGPRFADVNTAFAGTFADVNRQMQGKTFADVNALPFDRPEA